jgi:hypothetical protein
VEARDYRDEAEEFLSALDREYYEHYAGLKDEFEIEPIYDRHAGLFAPEAVEALRGAGGRELLEFAVHGLLGRATAREAAELARREAALEVSLDGERLPFRQAAIMQANEPDPARREALERARLELTERELNPLLQEAHGRAAELARELGWESMRALCQELSGVDLLALGRDTERFLRATEDGYEQAVEPELRRQLGLGLGELRRSDLPAFFRAPSLDPSFPAARLQAAFRETAAGLGIDLDALPNIHVDADERPSKTPRAFCSPVRVPDEVHLVIAPTGGRDDYETLLHEAGHALHYGHVERSLPFEHRYLGDNAVTESYAFLLQHLAADPEWLRRRLGVADPEPITAFARASKLVFLRRYCAKLGYELELHGDGAGPGDMRALYAKRLSDAVRVDWPSATWLADVDAFFYAACYLRAWALETYLRRHLRGRFGEAWFDEPEAGALLRSLWREGQRQRPEDLLEELTGERLEFAALATEMGS